jgi:Peptidase family S41
MIVLKNLICVLLFLCISLFLDGGLLAQSKSKKENYRQPRTISLAELQEEYKLLRESLISFHPLLVDSLQLSYFKTKTDSLQSMIKEGISNSNYHLIIAKTLTYLQDGHTDIFFDPTLQKFMENQALVFPFFTLCKDDKLYVLTNGSDDMTIPIGSEIVSINQIPMSTLLEKIYEYITSDVKHSRHKQYKIGTQFFVYYALVWGISESFKIDYKPFASSEVLRTTVSGQKLKKILTNSINHPQSHKLARFKYHHFVNDESSLKLRILGNSDQAALNVKDFVGEDFESYLDLYFQTIKSKKINHLIIDLRNNPGGSLYLMFRLINYLGVEDATKGMHIEFGNKIDERFKELIKQDSSKANAYRIKSSSLNKKSESKRHNNFYGKVYVLINGGTFSAANIFASLIRQHKRGVLIGEETGGAVNGTFGFINNPNRLVLPHTKIVVNIAINKIVFSQFPEQNAPIQPDFPIQPSIKNVIKGVDEEFYFAVDLMSKE